VHVGAELWIPKRSYYWSRRNYHLFNFKQGI